MVQQDNIFGSVQSRRGYCFYAMSSILQYDIIYDNEQNRKFLLNTFTPCYRRYAENAKTE